MSTEIYRIFLYDEQFFWLEEKFNCYVEIYRQKPGEPFVEGLIGETVKVEEIPTYIQNHENENLWRSWTVYKNRDRSHEVGPLPLILDIDDEFHLEKAHGLTNICLNILQQMGISRDNVRVVFTGHKGFHIEIKPYEPVEARAFQNQIIEQCKDKDFIPLNNNIFWGSTVLDPVHYQVRLTGSLNSWHYENRVISRKVIQLSIDEFSSLHLDEILERSSIHKSID